MIRPGVTRGNLARWEDWKARHGIRHPQSVLTDKQVRKIRMMAKEGARQHVIAEEFGVSQPTVSKIVRKVSYRHVKRGV